MHTIISFKPTNGRDPTWSQQIVRETTLPDFRPFTERVLTKSEISRQPTPTFWELVCLTLTGDRGADQAPSRST